MFCNGVVLNTYIFTDFTAAIAVKLNTDNNIVWTRGQWSLTIVSRLQIVLQRTCKINSNDTSVGIYIHNDFFFFRAGFTRNLQPFLTWLAVRVWQLVESPRARTIKTDPSGRLKIYNTRERNFPIKNIITWLWTFAEKMRFEQLR